MENVNRYATFFITLLLQFKYDKCEVFTSMANMENLAQTEKYLLTSFKSYLKAEEDRLALLKTFMKRVEEAQQFVNDTDIGKYLGNPVNTYLMLRRLSLEWKDVEQYLTHDTEEFEDFMAVYDIAKTHFPSNEDHEGAMTALFRLQDTYKLPSNKLAKGIIPGVHNIMSQELELSEIYELGLHAYEMKDFAHAREWMRTALDTMVEDEGRVKKNKVLDYLAFSEFKQGNLREAFKLTNELAKLLPQEDRIKSNLEYYRQELRKSQSTGKRGDTGLIDEAEQYKDIKNTLIGSETEAQNKRSYLQDYEKLCRGEIREQTRKEIRRMKCWYKTSDPVLILKPQKVERIWASPEIFMLRDILDESQVEQIKKNAYPILRRATIQDPITGKLRHADYRVSKSAWLSPTDHEFVRKIGIRAQAVTGLDMNAAEQLQIANYGIGGHYEPHFDHARDDEDKFTDLGLGNRIATILYYLSDVEAGGATVFTVGKTAVFPSKRDAVFWYNLKRNGNGDPTTRHAACPVLVGQKWVSNWWIHEYKQEFRRKCALKENL